MLAFQLPFGSLIETRPAVLSGATPPPAPEAAAARAVTAEVDATPGGAQAHATLDFLSRIEGAASVLDAEVGRAGATEQERLLSMVAATLREFDCGVVVCGSADRSPAVLVLGRHAAAADPGAGHGVAPPDGAPARPRAHAAEDDERSLLTLLFTDIVDSTALAVRLGDDAWRHLLERHRRIVREQLAAFRGVEIDNAGDGFFATFDSPARAVRCGEAIAAALAGIGVAVRAGIHAGECATDAGRISGVAVHVAARIVEVALPGEVLVSATVRDLVAGSGLEFRDRDWHALKGLSGARQLFALEHGAAA